MEVFTLTEIDTVTDANGFQTHYIGLGLDLCQYEHTLNQTCSTQVAMEFFKGYNILLIYLMCRK